MKNFNNKVVVITGGANGFGREFANIASTLGMRIVLADVQQEALDRAKKELESHGSTVFAMQCDVSKPADMQALADATMESFGTVHLLFNNAGVGTGGLVWENTVDDWKWVLGVNLWGVINGVSIFTKLMLACAKNEEGYEGHIVNTASAAGLLNTPLLGIYNVSKHAVVSLTETLNQDLKLVNAPISASVLCPFFAPTGINQSHKNRPNELFSNTAPSMSQRLAKTMVDRAVRSGKITAAQIAEMTFQGIRENKFYILTHPEILSDVQDRMENILHQRNPSDSAEISQNMRDMLRVV